MMAGKYRSEMHENPDKKMEISFNIIFEDHKVSGTLIPAGRLTAFGVPTVHLVHIPGIHDQEIKIEEGEWIVEGAPEEFVNALGEWIEIYYE